MRRFLVVEDNPDGLSLIARTLTRKFADCEIIEARELAEAVALAAKTVFDAIICHRAGVPSGEEAVRELRRACPTTPIIMVSGIDRAASATAAGADAFVLYDAWLTLGPLLEDLLSRAGSRKPWPAN